MGMATAVTDSDFATEIEGHKGLAMVDFWAEWCGPCKAIGPMIEQLATEYKDSVKIRKMNVDENPATQLRYNVRSIPAVIFFKDGTVIDQVIGAQPRPAFEGKIKQHAA